MMALTPTPEARLARIAREQVYGVTNYELQAMLEVDHADWPKHSEEVAFRARNGIAFTRDEADLAVAMIHRWVKESGLAAVRQALTDAISDRRNPDGSRRKMYTMRATPAYTPPPETPNDREALREQIQRESALQAWRERGVL